jgi:Tfp pilus tip-associated adhesin PilY1
MKRHLRTCPNLRHLLSLALAASLALPLASQAASITLATSPLATSTTSTVNPNVMFLLDNSGSMDWDHMPDDNSDAGSSVTYDYGYYGIRSNQCNQVYYDPSTTYLPPVDSTGKAYGDATFTAACANGFSGTCSVDLTSGFKANQSGIGNNAGGTDSSGPAYYYSYSGSQLSPQQKNVNSTTSTYYNECHSARYASPGKAVFTRIVLSPSATAATATIVANCSSCTSTTVSSVKIDGVELMAASTAAYTSTSNMAGDIANQIHANVATTGFDATASGSTVTITGLPATAHTLMVSQDSGTMTFGRTIIPAADAAQLTNFANWYSFYRTRLLMMKTAAGRAFKTLDNHYRVGFTKLSSSTTPTVYMGTFEGTLRDNWYSSLYATVTSGSTPLRKALSDAGRYFAGKESGTDPMQYSCQQNFTIMSTDGFWNGAAGYDLYGNAVGNQDGLEDPPMYDGSGILKTQTQVSQSQVQWYQQTSTLMGTLSKVLMRCNNTAAACGAAPATGVADANWSVVTAGSCSSAASVQCAIVNVSGAPASPVANNCNVLGANITSGTGYGRATITISGSSNARISSVKVGGKEILSARTSSSSTDSTVASRVASNINNCTNGIPWGSNCTASGNSATVSGNVVTITGPNVTGIPTVNVSNGSATVAYAYTAGGPTYTLNNADSNGDIYSSCVYTAWSPAAPGTLVASCNNVYQGVNPNNTTTTSAVSCQKKSTTPTLVAACTPSTGVAPDYISTVCTPTATTTTVSSCHPEPATDQNSYTSTSCALGTGGTYDTLADVAMYYYNTDLRTSTLNNCTGSAGVDVCENNVFKTPTDDNIKQHMVTFTLGMGANGLMDYSPSYLSDTTGDYYSVWKQLVAHPAAPAMALSINGTTATLVSSIKVGGVELMSGPTAAETDPSKLAGDIAANISLNGYTATASGNIVTISPTPASVPVIAKSGDMIFSVGPICAWQADNTTCNWPVPGLTSGGDGYIANIDDLWHAAVNGHGQYFSATSPTALANGLSSALATIAARKGASAAAATSTLNPVPGNNYAYVASYTTMKWQGNLEARTIDVNTLAVSPDATWCVENIAAGTCAAPATIVADTSGSSVQYNCVTANSTQADCTSPGQFFSSTSECRVPMVTGCYGTMPGLVGSNSDTRTIYTANGTATALVDFAYANLDPTDFDAAHIGTLSQWSSLTATQQANAVGANLVNFLRGQTGYEDRAINASGATDNRLYRYREATLGDALESQPMYIGAPVLGYTDAGYSDYANLQASRPGTVYMGTNDGMLHAFSALAEGAVPGGTERWAYVPSMVIPNMWKLADKNYSTMHTNFVNGSPIVSDICPKDPPATCSGTEWKTILVGGLNAGGRGYYALDVTDPKSPKLLWEFTTTAGQGSTKDDDLGYTYGTPIITAKSDGTWIVLVTSGYNNTSPGNGQGYLYVLNANTGVIISKIGTGAGDTTTPSGLSKVSAWNDVATSNRTTFVYGGDLLGNIWRFDLNGSTPAAVGTGDVFQFATLMDPSGNPQPITTPPVLGKISGNRVIFVGTGKYLEVTDLKTTQVQTEYALKDVNVAYTNPAGSPRVSTPLVQQTLTPGTTSGSRVASSNPVDWNVDSGWYIDLPDSGERVNIESRLLNGVLVFASIVPSNTVCSPGGYGWLNYVDYKTGGAIDSSGVASTYYGNSIVGMNVLYKDGAPVIETVTNNDPTPSKDPNVKIPPTKSGFIGQRELWRQLNP